MKANKALIHSLIPSLVLSAAGLGVRKTKVDKHSLLSRSSEATPAGCPATITHKQGGKEGFPPSRGMGRSQPGLHRKLGSQQIISGRRFHDIGNCV